MNTSHIAYYRSSPIELIHIENSYLSYPKHNHCSIYTIGVILNGKLQLQYQNQAIDYSTNSFFIINPYTLHAINAIETYSLLSICIDKQFIQYNNKNQIRKKLLSIFRKLPKKPTSTSKIFPLINLAINQIYLTLSNTSNHNKRLIQVINYLEKHPEIETSLEQLARYAHISKYHFIRAFKKQIGLTPYQFIIQNRIRKAQRLLDNNISIADAASTTGFYDQSHLIKFFKSYLKMTPHDYKRACIIDYSSY